MKSSYLVSVLYLLAFVPGVAWSDRPNIVFILADDLGIGDIACYGADRCRIKTPHIDQLARDGVRFRNAYVNASVCVPTRVGIMTGRYPWRFGQPQAGGAWGFLGPRFDPSTPTLGSLLSAAGYRTGYVGKWHLGTVMATTDGLVQGETNVDYQVPLTVGPPQYGFDTSFILPGSLDMYPYVFARDNIWQGEVTAQKGWSAFNRVGPADADFEDHQVLETFYQEAESFIEGQTSEQPFFLYLALTAPHTPVSPGRNFRGKSDLGVYGDFVMEVDHAVQRVRQALQRRGFAENTLVLFSSDHGAASYAGNTLKATPGQIRKLEEQGHYASGPHRGYKFSVYEGGLRVPLIASWPGVVPEGSEAAGLVGLCDLLATVAALAGLESLPDSAQDSISFARMLREPTAESQRESLVMQGGGFFVIRQGKWKLCLCPGSGASGRYGNEPASETAWRRARTEFGRPPSDDDLRAAPFVQLFDVESDLHEDRNVAAAEADRVSAMVGLLLQEIARGHDLPRVNIHARVPAFVRH